MKWLDKPAEIETSNVVTAVMAPANCNGDHLENITQSLACGEDINQTEALFYAIANDKLDVVQHLLKLGADVGYKNKYGATPLHIAAEDLKVKMCQVLVSHGANKEALDATGKTPFEVAIAKIENYTRLVATFNLN
jgi:ankyrin repeat protein